MSIVRCKPNTPKDYLMVTIKSACIECNGLPRSALLGWGGLCLDKFRSEIRRSTSRRAVAKATQVGLHSLSARLLWRVSPALREQTKTA
jgi:hypothetical protein